MKAIAALLLLAAPLLPVAASAEDPDLRDISLDYTYIMIAHDSLAAAVAPLRDHRQTDYCGNFSNSHKVLLVTRSLVESQFGDAPQGIKDFLSYAYCNWAATPEYVLLVGHGTWVDASEDTTCLIPEYPYPYYEHIRNQVWTDDWYVCVDGQNDIEPDMIIGRLPAKSPQDVEAYVAKVLAYDLCGISRNANDNLLFLCHDVLEPNPPETYPVGAARVLRDSLVFEVLDQDWDVTTLTASDICNGDPGQCYDIWENSAVSILNESPGGNAPLVVGCLGTFSDERNLMYFCTQQMGFSMSGLNVTSVYPFFVGACCELGQYWHGRNVFDQEYEHLIAEMFLFEPDKGAIGWIAPSELMVRMHGAYWFSRALYSRLREPERTIGSAFLEAKLECLQSYGLERNAFRNFSLLGDPALVLAKNYDPEVTAVSAPNTVDPGEVAPLEVYYNDRNKTCCIGDCYDEIWSIDWDAELGTIVEDEGQPIVPPTATYYAPENVSGVYDHVTVTVTDKMGLTGQYVEEIYIRHSKPGCPYLFVNDGRSFRRDNNISSWAYSDGPNSLSSIDYYKLRIKPDGDEYQMEIRGLEEETSFLDETALLVIDHDETIEIALTPEGSAFLYTGLTPPASAVDRNGEDRLAGVVSRDTLAFKGGKDDYVILTFDAGGETAALAPSAQDDGDDGGVIMGGDGKVDPCEDGGCLEGELLAEGRLEQSAPYMTIPKGILVQVEDSNGRWSEVSFMRPREHPSEIVTPASAFGSQARIPNRIRLFWTGEHSLDFVGRVNRAAERPEVRVLEPIAASHSSEGSVLADLTARDDRNAVIRPAETLSLTFVSPPSGEGKVRDLVLVTYGYFTREPEQISPSLMSIPTRNALERATPNPFSSQIAIHYAVAPPGHELEIAVFDAKGRLVKTLLRGSKPAGRHVVSWDGKTEKGKGAPAGVYFCRMSTEQRSTSTKIVKME